MAKASMIAREVKRAKTVEKYAKKIASFGIKRINVSIDSLNPKKFSLLTNGGDLKKVLDGVYEAKANKIDIKINTVLLKDFNANEITSMVKWCSENNFKQSFIEVMPIGKTDLVRTNQFLPISVAQTKIRKVYGLDPILLKTNGVFQKTLLLTICFSQSNLKK